MKLTAEAADRVRRVPPGVVVLVYHRVGGGSVLDIDLPRAAFRDQAEALAASGRVVPIDLAIQILRGRKRPGFDPVVVTFDDGTADFVDEALPVVVKFGLPVTLYVATDYVERRRPFPHEGRPVSWPALADAVDTGLLTVGSHTHTHALLDRVTPEEARAELDRSIALIEDRLGVTPAHFAYPKAVLGTIAAQQEVRERFESAALGGTRANRYGKTDVHRLARSPIQVSDGRRWFERKVGGGMALEDDLRRLVARRRYAGATT
ncbi:MAG: polysaccharide deacetylase family protein [Acidimicrobiales bacterium]